MATWRRRRGIFQHQTQQPVAAIIEQFRRPHVARHQDGVVRQMLRRDAVAGEMALQPPRQIVEIMRALAQKGIAQALHAQAQSRPARARPRLRRSGRCAPHRACSAASPGPRRTGDRPRSLRGPRRSDRVRCESSIWSTTSRSDAMRLFQPPQFFRPDRRRSCARPSRAARAARRGRPRRLPTGPRP